MNSPARKKKFNLNNYRCESHETFQRGSAYERYGVPKTKQKTTTTKKKKIKKKETKKQTKTKTIKQKTKEVESLPYCGNKTMLSVTKVIQEQSDYRAKSQQSGLAHTCAQNTVFLILLLFFFLFLFFFFFFSFPLSLTVRAVAPTSPVWLSWPC